MLLFLFMPENIFETTEKNAESRSESVSPSADKWSEGSVSYKGAEYVYNTGIKTYLFMGVDRPGIVSRAEDGISGGQSDVMFLLLVDKSNEKLKVIAINRNTMCLVDVYDEEDNYQGQNMFQLCLQHAYGDGMGISCRRTVEAVERLFYNIPISGYIALNMDGMKLLNRSVGGVTIQVEEDYTTRDGMYSFQAGETRTLTDDEAYAYIRSRDINEFASADARLARQINYMNAFIEQMKAQMAAGPGKAASVYKSIEDYTVASIDAVNLLEKIADYSFEEADMLSIPGKTKMGSQFEEYHIDEGAFYDLVMDVFYVESGN
ncbi:MAG: LCP family protein [Lachnospiraceae bacterium]|nr:LCP family protein [Lachnospiraceae bacterium]